MTQSPSHIMRVAIADFVQVNDDNMDAVARQVCQEAGFRVIVNTPVDVGVLRGSWQPSIGDMAFAPADVPEDPEGVMASAKVSLMALDVKAGDVFHMSNNCEYAMPVEQGTVFMMGRWYVAKTLATIDQICVSVIKSLGLSK